MLIGYGVPGPHPLGYHGASVYDSAVKKPEKTVQRFLFDASGVRAANEEIVALSVGKRHWKNLWKLVDLQQVEEVSLSLTALESLGDVAVHENRLQGRKKVMSRE
jgi:hypothetical protein